MDTVIRVTVIFILVIITLRLLGKRELGELSPYELVMLMLIPEIVSQGLSGEDYSLTGAAVGMATLFILVFANSLLSFRFTRYKDLLEGRPVVLYYQGKFLTDAMDRERVTADEIMTEIRTIGYEKMEQIKWVVLEPDGNLSCIPHEHGVRASPRKEMVAQ